MPANVLYFEPFVGVYCEDLAEDVLGVFGECFGDFVLPC